MKSFLAIFLLLLWQSHACIQRHPEHGRVKVWIDGRPAFDFESISSAQKGGPFKISPVKIYHEPADKFPKQLFIDDITIWPGWVEPDRGVEI